MVKIFRFRRIAPERGAVVSGGAFLYAGATVGPGDKYKVRISGSQEVKRKIEKIFS